MILMRSGQEAFKDYTAEDIAKHFNIPLEKIRKQPEFILNPERIVTKSGQSSEISIPAGRQFPANLFFKHEGKSYEIRYAETINQVWKGEKLIDEYEPRKVMFKGKGQLISDNDDLIVYMFLHPDCKQSPFRSLSKEAYYYAFKDVEAESNESMADTMELVKALTTISQYSGDQLRVIAKSFGITGTDQMVDVTVQMKLVEYAKNPHTGGPAAFNKTINSTAHLFKGVIRNAIDSGVFVTKESGSGKIWAWGKTDLKGKRIVEIHENGAAESESLINHILDDLEYFYPILTNISRNMKSESKADKFFSKQTIDLAAMFSDAPQDDIVNDDDDDLDNGESGIGGGSKEQSEEPITPAATIVPVAPAAPAVTAASAPKTEPKATAPKPKDTKPKDQNVNQGPKAANGASPLPKFLQDALDKQK